MAKSRPINRRAKSKTPLAGGRVGSPTQNPRGQGGPPSKTEAPHSTMMNTSMTKPGKGTRGSNKGVR